MGDFIESNSCDTPAICNDASSYNFGSNWEKIFIRLPRLIESQLSLGNIEHLEKSPTSFTRRTHR